MSIRFQDREDAGRRLGAVLARRHLDDALVLALPRGGVAVGLEVARALGAPLEVIIARKLGAPGQPELGVGAIAEGGAVSLDGRTLRALAITADELEEIAARESTEVNRRAQFYRSGPLPQIAGRTVVLVDDGVATGGTMRAAARAVQLREPRRVIAAVPVIAAEAVPELRAEVDEVVALRVPERLVSIGAWYDDFTQLSDEEVIRLLDRARSAAAPIEPVPG